MAKPRYDTVLDRCSSKTEKIVLSYICENILGPPDCLQNEGPDPVRLAQVQDVIETAVSGRKYEVLLLRSQGKSMAEIAMLLSLSKSTVQSHYRRAIHQVRQALGLEPLRSRLAEKAPAASPSV